MERWETLLKEINLFVLATSNAKQNENLNFSILNIM